MCVKPSSNEPLPSLAGGPLRFVRQIASDLVHGHPNAPSSSMPAPIVRWLD